MDDELERGDEVPYGWIDDLDFEALDCVEIERGDEPPYGEWLADDPHFNAWLDYANERNT